MAVNLRRRGEFDSDTILPLDDYPPGEYVVPMYIQGNSILSSLFVASVDPGATVSVEYFEITTGSAEREGEEILLEVHPPLTGVPGTSKLTVTRIHEKPRVRMIVTGGNVRAQVHTTVVTSFASDLDAALKYEEQPADLTPNGDRGIPLVGYDEGDTLWHFLRVDNGVLQVGGEVAAGAIFLNTRKYNQSLVLLAGSDAVHIDYTIPAGKVFRWLAGWGTADDWVLWRVEIDGATWLTARNAFDAPNVDLVLQGPVALTEGQNIKVTVYNLNPYGQTANVETMISGSEIDA